MLNSKNIQLWQIAYDARRQRWASRYRSYATLHYNLLHRFPFITWPVKLMKAALFTTVILVLALLVSIEMGVFGALPVRSDLVRITHPLASEVLADNGYVLGRYYYENRSNVRIKDISPHFIDALIATEDARFFYHDGVDLRSWARVFFKSILKKDRTSGGGSTLSQQLAKNLYPRRSYDDPKLSLLINKLREVFIARRLELLYSKEKVLELYSNTVSFSENTYGIKVAAQRFFNTHPRHLTPSQSATLVAMLKAPSSYDPIRYPEQSLQRRNLVLEQMARYGYLSFTEADSLQREPLCLEYYPLAHDYGPATYFREHLRLKVKDLLSGLRKKNGMAYNIYTDGLKIYTTLDPKLQYYAEESVREHMRELQKSFVEHLQGADPWEVDTVLMIAKYNSARYRQLRRRGMPHAQIDSIFETPVSRKVFSWDGEKRLDLSPMDSIRYYLGFLNAGLMAMEPNSGQVKAWVGGIDYKYFKYDHVKSKRQVGSTFKPIVYTTALQQGISPCSYTANTLRRYGRYEGWMPKNATNRYGGYFSMKGGLVNSINTVTVNLAMRAKPRNVAVLAEKMGISGPVPRVPAIALGAIDASLLDMVTVYGTLANRGRRPEPYYIRRIESPDGEVILDFETERDTCNWEQPLFHAEADIINDMLRAVIDQGTGRRLRWRYELPNVLAGKTGTSQHHSDGWFMGFTPRLVTGVWVGAESPAVRFRNLRLGQGANTALPVFGRLVKKLNADGGYEHYVNAPFPEPSDTVRSQINCRSIIYPEDVPTDSLETKKPVALGPQQPAIQPIGLLSETKQPASPAEPVAAKPEEINGKNDQ